MVVSSVKAFRVIHMGEFIREQSCDRLKSAGPIFALIGFFIDTRIGLGNNFNCDGSDFPCFDNVSADEDRIIFFG